MGFLARTASFSQITLEGMDKIPNQAELFELISAGLAKHAFCPIDQSAEEKSIGWVQLENSDDTDFSNPNTWQRDGFLAFSMRQDLRKISTAVLRRQLDKLSAEFLEQNPGLKRVPKARREELREMAKLDLLTKTLPIPSTVDLVWDVAANRILLTSISPKVIDQFSALFLDSFPGLRPVLLTPFARARNVAPAECQEALQAANQTSSEAVLDQIKANAWLGMDFLCWLLAKTIDGKSEFQVNQPGPLAIATPFVVYLDHRLSLVGAGENGVQKVSVSGPQDFFTEVKAALAKGKNIGEATICFEQEESEFKLTLKGDRFNLASYKTPAINLDRDDTDRSDELSMSLAMFFEKIHLVKAGIQLFDSAFAQFLAVRLDSSWPLLEQQIRNDLQDAA